MQTAKAPTLSVSNKIGGDGALGDMIVYGGTILETCGIRDYGWLLVQKGAVVCAQPGKPLAIRCSKGLHNDGHIHADGRGPI